MIHKDVISMLKLLNKFEKYKVMLAVPYIGNYAIHATFEDKFKYCKINDTDKNYLIIPKATTRLKNFDGIANVIETYKATVIYYQTINYDMGLL